MVEEISVEELKAQLEAGAAPLVIDVREAWELDISRLGFAQHLPMGEITARIGELDPQAPLGVMCRSGGRSRQVCWFLEKRGFRSV
ncbi:MAG: rhodanese-like domain-containing protein, partial [Nevskiaceae bacterium]